MNQKCCTTCDCVDVNALEIIVNYDDAECDGYCLKEDIEYYFDEYGSGQ